MIAGDPRKQVLLAMPVFQSVYPAPLEVFMRMCFYAGAHEHEKYSIVPYVLPRQMLHSAMNRAAHDAITQGFDVFMMADDDCLPPLDAISRLLRHYENGIECVSGLGFMRGFPHTTTAGRYYPEGASIVVDEHGIPKLSGFEWIDDVSQEPPLMPVDFCGFPITMVTTDALKRMTRPWFGTATPLGECTHDVFFGDRAKEIGMQMYVDTTMVCGHLADPYVIAPDMRELARAVRKQFERANDIEIARRQAEDRRAEEDAAK